MYKYASALLNVYITAFIGDTIKTSKTACREFESYCPCHGKPVNTSFAGFFISSENYEKMNLCAICVNLVTDGQFSLFLM